MIYLKNLRIKELNESITKIGKVRTQKYGQYNSINWLNSKILEFINVFIEIVFFQLKLFTDFF